MTETKQKKCAHELCSCPPAADSKYCSSYCEAAKNTTDIACGCEHSGCKGSV